MNRYSPKFEFLNPAKPLVWEVVRWLCGDAKSLGCVRITSEGAHSLAHLMLVVPTAQSGRNLRLALAETARSRGWGGILPPKVVLPMQLVKPADETHREATALEAAAAFQQYVKSHRAEIVALDALVRAEEFEDLTARFALFDQLQDIWRTLAGRGLLMSEVLEIGGKWIEAEYGDEKRRWEQLSELERGYFGFLHERGLSYPTERVHLAKQCAAEIDEGIEEIVLPALADPIRVLDDVLEQQLKRGRKIRVLLHVAPECVNRFDKWGWPKTDKWTGAVRPTLDKFTDDDIACAANFTELSHMVAGDFPEPQSDADVPALTLCDNEMFQKVSSAFLYRGYEVHNPERHMLVKSSLGRLIRDLLALYASGDAPWREFVSVLRSDDVQRALGIAGRRRCEVLGGIDIAQNAFIPSVIPMGMAFPKETGIRQCQQASFEAFCTAGMELEEKLAECRRGATLGGFVRNALKWIFSAHAIADGSSEKELLAAAECARELLGGLDGEFVASLKMNASEMMALARRELDMAVYSLEPDSVDAIKTEGWLELAWSMASRMSLVGLHEGKIPDSVIGHPFLPDSLRAELGIVTNEDRMARDSWILSELLDSHAAHSIRAYVARTNDEGDICRPSRLAYLCTDRQLVIRVKKLFGYLPERNSIGKRCVEWALRLPEEIEKPTYFSASALDTYIKCPFTYLLKCGLKMTAYREKRELEASDFGSFIHAALEQYSLRQIALGDEQITDAQAIKRMLMDDIIPGLRARFGKPTLNIELQLQAAAGRLELFADEQAKWAAAGWRIRKAEHQLCNYVPKLGFNIHGSIDRVDENISVNAPKRWCLIDYKTWDKKSLIGHIFTSNKSTKGNSSQLELARQLGFPIIDGKQRMLSIQLPVYGVSLAAQEAGMSFSDMEFRYLLLGPNSKATGFIDELKADKVSASLETAKRAVELIGKGIFWPPGPTKEWKWDFAGLFVNDPQSDLGTTDWAARQLKRLEAADV